MDADIKLIKKQNTEEAKYFFNTSRDAYSILKTAVDKDLDGEWLMDMATAYAKQNDDFFGSLFVAELDAVQWQDIIDEERANVTRPKRR